MPVVKSNAQYELIHDRGRELCFIGSTETNRLLTNYFNAETVSLEFFLEQPQEWIDQYQFMSCGSHPTWKTLVATAIEQKNAQCFSVAGSTNVFGQNVDIGYNVIIHHYNEFWDNVKIGNHCSITNQGVIAHGATLGDYCHLGPYCHLSFCNIGSGAFIGPRSWVFGIAKDVVSISDYTNITADSRVVRSITEPGTYYGNRRIKNLTSLELDLHNVLD